MIAHHPRVALPYTVEEWNEPDRSSGPLAAAFVGAAVAFALVGLALTDIAWLWPALGCLMVAVVVLADGADD